ncbi:MAG: MBL fold metallo-hydrolase, partial [Candidatus Thermoplasmatota archaeon]|nr:MBL fold metallo-hydrolase [Candidatus Thermoplasmatota archaeon]
GKVVIPAFAVGRTQEVLLLLKDVDAEIWLDGMGKAINKIYLGYGEYLRDYKKLARATGRVNVVRNQQMRKAAQNGDIIVTTSGMMDGGPVLQYVSNIMKDERSAIILTGYQVDGTNGRRLIDEGLIDINGDIHRPRCEVAFIDLSAHSGHSQLVDFAKKCKPKKIILMHGDNRQILADALSDKYEVVMPNNGELIHL